MRHLERKRLVLTSLPFITIGGLLIIGTLSASLWLRKPIYPNSSFLSDSGIKIEYAPNSYCANGRPCKSMRISTTSYFESQDSYFQIETWFKQHKWDELDTGIFTIWPAWLSAGSPAYASITADVREPGKMRTEYGFILFW